MSGSCKHAQARPSGASLPACPSSQREGPPSRRVLAQSVCPHPEVHVGGAGGGQANLGATPSMPSSGAGALGVFPIYHAFTQDLSARHQGKITGLAGVVAWVLPAQAQKLFGSLADRTHSFDLGLVLAAFLPLLAALPLSWWWEKKEPAGSDEAKA